MDVYPGSNTLERQLREPVVAIGNFDGVHLGHRQLLDAANEEAKAMGRGGETAVLTFDPHPAKVLVPDRAPPLIQTTARKLELIAEAGVSVCVVEPFTPALAALPAAEFVSEVLVRRLNARAVVVGWDFTYGRGREGNATTLTLAGATHGFGVRVIPAVVRDGIVVSSSRIRALVHAGDVEAAAVLLGRGFEVEGITVRGAGRGRKLGVPTANIAPETELLPGRGVYAGHVLVLDEPGVPTGSALPHPAVINLGTNPTFVATQDLSLEAHLLDFEGELCGRRLRVVFHSWLRGEERFPSTQALLAQIRQDIATARRRFAGARP